MKLINKIVVLFRLFPYLPPSDYDSNLFSLYYNSIQKANVKFRFLFWLSTRYQFFCEKLNRPIKFNHSAVYEFEIEVLNKKKSDFLYQNQILHFFYDGTQAQKEIINNKNTFHDFCENNAIPTTKKIGELNNGHLQNMTVLPWETAEDFLVKPIFGFKSIGILDFRSIGNNKYEILDETREINSKNIAKYLAYFLPTGSYIIQKRLKPPVYLQNQGLVHVPIIRILSCKSGDNISILNPVLILNVEKKYLNPRLNNKIFYAIDALNGKIIDQIHFTKKINSMNHLAINTLPEWDALVETVHKAHALLDSIRLIGWDIALSCTGYTIIEANKSPWLEIHQKTPFVANEFQKRILI